MSPYDILNVTPHTPFDDIKKAYRRLAQKHHPDKAHGNEEQFKKIKLAFEWIEEHYGQLYEEEEPVEVKVEAEKSKASQYAGDIYVTHSHYVHGFYFPRYDATFNSCIGYHRIRVAKNNYSFNIIPKVDDAWCHKKSNPELVEAHINHDGTVYFTVEQTPWRYALGYPVVIRNDIGQYTFKKMRLEEWCLINKVPGFFNSKAYIYMRKPKLNWLQRMVRALFD